MSITENAAKYGHFKPHNKNLLINGSFLVWQQGTGGASLASGSTVGDMWKIHNTTTAVLTYARIEGNTVTNGHYGVDVYPTTADAVIASTLQSHLSHRIEGRDVAHLKIGSASAKTVTLSFWHLHTKVGTYCVSFSNDKLGLATRTYVAEYTQSVSQDWEYAEITIDLDTSGTWNIGEGEVGLEIRFARAIGTNFHTTADAWQAGAYLSTSNQVNGYDAISNLNRVAGAKLEVGSVRTDMETPHVAEELAKCKRYWEKSYEYDVAVGTASDFKTTVGQRVDGLSSIAHVIEMEVNFEVEKAVAPTVVSYSPGTGNSGKFYDGTPTAVDITATIVQANTRGVRIRGTQAAAKTEIRGSTHWTAAAEL